MKTVFLDRKARKEAEAAGWNVVCETQKYTPFHQTGHCTATRNNVELRVRNETFQKIILKPTAGALNG